MRLNVANINDNNHKAMLRFSDLQNNQWYHAVMVIDRVNNILRGYVNGSQQDLLVDPNYGATFSSGTITSSNKELQLGARNDEAAEFKGYVDDFAIWKRMLSSSEIAVLYELGQSGETFVELPPPDGTVIVVY